MRLVGLLIFSLLLQICSLQVAAETTVRLKGPKSTENPDRSRVGPLTPNDTLWRIAEQTRPHPGLNIYQVMYAIYLKNPQSFLDDNFNHLNTGSFLAIPSTDEILSVDAVDAQRKSEEDDRIWADRVRAAAAAKVKQGINTAQQQDVDKAKQEIKKELIRVEGQQQGQLLDLQEKLAESKLTVEAVLADNTALKTKLDQLSDQMLLMKSQVDKDSEIQQQLQLLVAQQAEMLAQQKAQIEREQQGINFAGLWQNVSSSGLTWVLLASLPTLFVLFAVLGWIKRRTRKSEQIINAATAMPQQEQGYRSPLPPLDESLDFDENSLMTLDESLLDTGGEKGIRLDDEPIDLHDDMLLDTHSNEFDDILMNDDDLLDSKDLFDASSMDDELLDDLLDEPAKVPAKEFDPNNILSGADLSALFDEEPEPSADEDIFAQAVAEQLAEEQKLKQAEQAAEDSEEIIEEIELDDTDLDVFEVTSPVDSESDSLTASDELTQVEEVDFDSSLDELVITSEDPDLKPVESGQAEAALVEDVLSEQPHFDSSELDEFAESLVDEDLSGAESGVLTKSDNIDSDIDIDALLDEDSDSLSAGLLSEPAQPYEESSDWTVTSNQLADTELEFDEDDYPLSPDDVALLLKDEVVTDSTTLMPNHFHADHADIDELMLDVQPQSSVSDLRGEEQQDDSGADLLEIDSDDGWQELTEPLLEPLVSESVPDLDLQEDLTVSRVSTASLSVENPSKVLDQYPDLEFSDDALQLDDPEDDLELDELQLNELSGAEKSPESRDVDEAESELEALEETDFDTLLADYAQTDTATRQLDEQLADQALAELTSEHSAESEAQKETELLAEELNLAEDLDLSLLALDKLLEDSEDEIQAGQTGSGTLDLRLEDYQDFIAAQHEPEPDPLEQAFAADLDLIRAYIEIGEQDGAEHLIAKVLNSAAPEHIKQEAQSLKDKL